MREASTGVHGLGRKRKSSPKVLTIRQENEEDHLYFVRRMIAIIPFRFFIRLASLGESLRARARRHIPLQARRWIVRWTRPLLLDKIPTSEEVIAVEAWLRADIRYTERRLLEKLRKWE